ncbi:zinc finger protein, putative [Plasmodium knowlesi strain H]|uniref:Zinc finger protein, putative n=3 Tax=Plasmodium knowlesi TaxID=5850 RepID=A0A5K1UKI9_PLAKH|nr:zinc finger protein, putative [Plasmodium knowlesi strain H]OTN64766.1 putative Zinc finger protein [Plasmodium knowlesi]CAA9988958.1 zinc finger protein, putative [Plasmodium knowlesi strain H]SBO24802.1 zinc finger protein, putative [Plasmodium knowlesi strain H]SBO28065.1 zinc finger protein, putative [Plasmodium knowlesi strain H]VVS78432.1 zinc finger protein, putative [Plasmodium knowlesi strain H]|eukprot:XP_002261306.1 hypothetical protein, conserved in Plasmodium species [Plasmodium knowlesi strain H]
MKMSVTLRQHFWKTKLCPLHMENRCKEGSNCDYAHSIEDLRSIPDLKRTKLCYKLLKGEKCFNKKCNYAHNQEELKSAQNLFAYKSSMCKFVANKTCLNGSTCRFAHTIDELRVPRIPEILLEKTNVERAEGVDGETDFMLLESGGNIICEASGDVNCTRKDNAGGAGKEGLVIDMENNFTGSLAKSFNKNGSRNGNKNGNRNSHHNDLHNGNRSFTQSFDLMLSSFNSMQITQNEHVHNSTNGGLGQNRNNGANHHREERKRRDRNRNRNKEKQLKLKMKNSNYVKKYEDDSTNNNKAVMNSFASSCNKKKYAEERDKFYDSNTTISSSLNCAEEGKKDQMNTEACVSNTFEKVDMNECYVKTEESIGEGSREEAEKGVEGGDTGSATRSAVDSAVEGTVEGADRTASGKAESDAERNRETSTESLVEPLDNQSKVKRKRDPNNHPKCDIASGSAEQQINNQHIMNGQTDGANYMNYNYDYNSYLNPVVYNKMIQMKYNTYNPYFNYNQANNIACKYDGSAMPSPYPPFAKPNEFYMYDHQSNVPHMSPNYYGNCLYFYANPYSYGQCAMVNKMKGDHNGARENVSYTGDQAKVPVKSTREPLAFNESDDSQVNANIQGEQNDPGEQTSSEEFTPSEKLAPTENVADAEESLSDRQKVKNEIRSDGGEEASDEADRLDGQQEGITDGENTQVEENKLGKIKKHKGHTNQCNVTELKAKSEYEDAHMNKSVRTDYSKKGNNCLVGTNEWNKCPSGNFTEERMKQAKGNTKQKKKKLSKLLSLNSAKKGYNRDLCVSNENTIGGRTNGSNKHTESAMYGNSGNLGDTTSVMKYPKNTELQYNGQVNPSSVYSYILHANNAESANYEKRFMKPPPNDMDLYMNNHYHMNQMANEQMMFNLSARNYGYYYYPYAPPSATYTDEVYLN